VRSQEQERRRASVVVLSQEAWEDPPVKALVKTAPGVGKLELRDVPIPEIGDVVAVGAPSDEAQRLPTALAMGADEALVQNESAVERLREFAPQCWIEASGAAAAIAAAVECTAKGGRIAVAGLGHGPWDVDMARVAYNSITIRGQWGGKQEYIPEAAELIREGRLKMSAPLSVMPLTQWREAFDLLRRQQAVKVLLGPSC
jgi:(R,R)-butanediol dehydrogenase/meso-butanediol dehydrogenase/diacetyl reductase